MPRIFPLLARCPQAVCLMAALPSPAPTCSPSCAQWRPGAPGAGLALKQQRARGAGCPPCRSVHPASSAQTPQAQASRLPGPLRVGLEPFGQWDRDRPKRSSPARAVLLCGTPARPRSAPGALPRSHPGSRCSWPRAHSSAATCAARDGRPRRGVLAVSTSVQQLAFAKESELIITPA